MEQTRLLLEHWVNREPSASLWLGVVAVLIFGASFARSSDREGADWSWLRRLVEALVQAILFVTLLGMAYFLLNSDYAAFSKIYGSYRSKGSLSQQEWQVWRDSYGDSLTQQDLRVRQYVTVERQETIQPDDPSKPVLYRYIQVEEPVTQSSIVGFDGNVTLTRSEPTQQLETFNGYTVEAMYEYDITNPTDVETRVVLEFPLSEAPNLYQEIQVKVNEEETSSYGVISGTLTWNEYLDPADVMTVSVAYRTRGMDGYVFEIPEQRDVTNFELTLAVEDEFLYWVRTSPESEAIQLAYQVEPPYHLYTWRIERSIMSPHFSLMMRQGWPYAPYHEMIATLPYAARASILFLSLATLTLLICGLRIHLRQVILLACAFVIPFLILMSGGVPTPESLSPAAFAGYQMKMLPVISFFSLLIAFVILRKLPRLPLVLILFLMVLFMMGYPFVGLQMDERKRNLIEGVVQAAMIAYVFGLTLFMRIRRKGEYHHA